MSIKPEYRGELAEAARTKIGYTQEKMAEFFGMTLNSWQKKEQNDTRVSVSEYHWLLLLLNQHPEYFLFPRLPDTRTLAQNAALAAFDLGLYLSNDLVLPRKAKSLHSELNDRVEAFIADWMKSINAALGDLQPPSDKDEITLLREQLEQAKAENEELKRQLESK